MIKIDKSTISTPKILDQKNPQSKGSLATQALNADHEKGVRTFTFDSAIYGHASVKEALISVQNKKCCFCESFVRHIAHGDVEHFRPKGGYQIDPDASLITPGYYWLAYDFENLYFSCQICNQKYKRNFFPLTDDSKRIKSHHHFTNLHLEEPLIIDPANDNPEDHIYFDQEIPKAKDKKGELTILRLGLDRDDLNEYRLKWLQLIRDIARHAAKGDLISLNLLQEAAEPQSELSLMVRSNFPFLSKVE
ncbi:hypothetical protein [Haliscomenobacter hydrossis]|uniref:TIGR02646 family protein n=1 Tax=Haliscomenobacter hydrossis (strain ATCC 27775 / DSM 1100 / LMG 10767 / O) TaxID=760192 RepID=F4KYF9_HALH1|nr:hypothetical protein [Haliscomenobacter hydrossis]AEE49400.1 hypothetical protein Halhy_1508 [Haliscomenobacter hydrossis DSM 1100]